ncbi:MAG TPA: hypothetical protein VHB21_05945 [Minicystis sp.]|nr:hypothetical protein [Minicystis sp.]
MVRHALVLALALALAPGCSAKKGTPEAVADAFVDAYFRHADQEHAKEFTALGATEMMDKEIEDTKEIRKGGYTAADAAPEITVRRGVPKPRDQRVRIPYEIRIRTDASHEVVRDADIELTKIDGAWKVVRVGLKPLS